MTQIAVHCNCGKTYQIPADKAGKRFKCVACGESLIAQVEAAAAAAPAAEEKAAPAPKARASAAAPAARRASAREAAPPKKFPLPLVIGAFAVLGLGGGAAIYFMKTGGNANNNNTPVVAPKPEAPKDPVAEKKSELTKKLAEADKQPNPVPMLLEIAAFCMKEPKLESDAKKIYEKVIVKDPENSVAHEALGHKKYEGDNAEFKGKWVDADKFALLTAADAAARAEAEKKQKEEEERARDPFIQKAKKRIDEMKAMIDSTNAFAKDSAKSIKDGDKVSDDIDKIKKTDEEPAKFKFFYACKEVPKPYLLAVQEDGFNTPESWASSFGEMLDALRRTFYRRYSPFVKLRDLSETPVPVWIFRSKGQYERWRRCGNGGPSTQYVGAFYTGTAGSNKSGMLYLWLRDSREEKDFTEDPILQIQDTLWHEGTHQLMDFNSPGLGFGEGNMPWTQEGFAEYVGTHRRVTDMNEPDHWRYFFGVPNVGRKQEIYGFGKLSDKTEFGEFVELSPSLKEVAHCDYPQFWAARAQQENKSTGAEAQKARQLVSGTYAYGWALCHFLQHGEEGKYREGFHKWLNLELTKGANAEEFDKIFDLTSDAKWKAFEQEFQDWLCLKMRRDFLDTSALKDKVFDKYQKEFEDAIASKTKK